MLFGDLVFFDVDLERVFFCDYVCFNCRLLMRTMEVSQVPKKVGIVL